MTDRGSGYTRQELEQAILGQTPDLTNDAVALAAGVPIDQARRLWRALGFPDLGEEAAFTDGDLHALSTVLGAVDKGAIDFETAVRLTRAVGQTMAKLADWQVATLSARVEQLEAGEQATGSRIGSALRLTEQVGIPFEKLLVYSWRRHLAAAVARVEALGARDSDLHTTQVTVGFADLVSFTALSNEMSEDRIGSMVEIFESRCADVVAARSGRVIKTLGDSVLFVSGDPVRAMDIGLSIVEVIGHDNRLPDVRIGLSTGSTMPNPRTGRAGSVRVSNRSGGSSAAVAWSVITRFRRATAVNRAAMFTGGPNTSPSRMITEPVARPSRTSGSLPSLPITSMMLSAISIARTGSSETNSTESPRVLITRPRRPATTSAHRASKISTMSASRSSFISLDSAVKLTRSANPTVTSYVCRSSSAAPSASTRPTAAARCRRQE